MARASLATYARSFEDFLAYWESRHQASEPVAATEDDVAEYARQLASRPPPSGAMRGRRREGPPAAATIRTRLMGVRAYFAHLVAAGVREDNPVTDVVVAAARRHDAARGVGGVPPRPWTPTRDEWQMLLRVAERHGLRTNLMLRLAHDAALRREELVQLRLGNFDYASRCVAIPANTKAGRLPRVVEYGEETSRLLAEYRDVAYPAASDGNTALFPGRSRDGLHLTPLRWSQIAHEIAVSSNLPQFTTATPRHLRLATLLSSGAPRDVLARYAGHDNLAKLARHRADD